MCAIFMKVTTPLFSACLHGELSPRAWMKYWSREHKALGQIITNPRLLKDIPSLSPQDQTSALEGFHKLVCFFAPKNVHFHFGSMEARCLFAALHFNENVARPQLHSFKGDKQWRVSYPKHKHGEGVLKAVKGPCTYDYVASIRREIMTLRDLYPSYSAARSLAKHHPPTMTSGLEAVPKAEVVEKNLSRFNHS